MKKNLKIISYVLMAIGVIIIIYVLVFNYQQTIQTISDQTGKTITNDKIENTSTTSASGKTITNDKIENTSTTSAYRLIIPSIGVDMKIVFVENEAQALRKGAWHFPGSGTPNNPDDYKNIVLSAHRYLYTSGPNTFFNLDKVEKDDLIIIKWDKKEYQYKVDRVYIVKPTEVSILKDTGIEKLTLFTCHPAFTTKQRLVVDAYPLE